MEGIRGFSSSAAGTTAAEPVVPPVAQAVRDPIVERADDFMAWLATTAGVEAEDAVRVDRIAAFERVKGALAAAQVRQTVAFDESQRASLPSWTPERTAARSIGSQIALARRESPTRGDAHVALAQSLVHAMPRTLAALTAGQISEVAAEGIHRAVEGVDPAVRREVDFRLAPELGQLGERSLAEAARRVVNDVDDEAATRRVERAIRGRRVTLRTAPDGMAYLTLLAPMAEAAGAFQAVEAEATAILGQPGRSGGASRRSAFWLADPSEPSTAAGTICGGGAEAPCDPARLGGQLFLRSGAVGRTRSQMMADVVISRLTGRAIGQPVPIEIQLVMTDAALHQAADAYEEPADRAPCRAREGVGREKRGQSGREGVGREKRGQSGREGAGREGAGREGAGREGAGREGAGREKRGQSTGGQSGRRERLRCESARGGSADPGRRADRAGQTRHRANPQPTHAHARGEGTGASSVHPAYPAAPSPSAARGGDSPSHDQPASPDTRSASNSPAKIVGAGWLPAGFARELVRRTAAGSEVKVRRVVVVADGATVVGLEARRRALGERIRPGEPMPVLAATMSMQRLFRGVLRRLVVIRDQACRTPFCAAAIRAVDHVTPARRDGPTCAHNAEGTCERCNFTKEAPGWKVIVLSPPPVARSDPSDPPWKQLMDELLAADAHDPAPSDGKHRTAVVTPTGHRYESTAPPVTERPRSAAS